MNRRFTRFAAAALAVLLLAGCTSGGDEPDPTTSVNAGPPTTLRVLAGSELADMQPILDEAAKATGVTVQMTYTGSLDGADTVASGRADGKYDAVWFSSLRYLETVPDAKKRLGPSARIMGSPVVLGLKESVAKRLGWDHNPVTWGDIAKAAQGGNFTFAMTDPSVSNTGFSALVAVASALDGSGRALDAAAIDRIAPQLAGFFAGQRVTAGSSEWLTDAFLKRDNGSDPGPAIDGLVNYESSLVALNRQHKTAEPLTLVYPKDGVVSADYPLTALADAGDPARAAEQRLADYLRTPKVQQRIVDSTARRAAVPGIGLPPESPQGLVELPFPDTRPAMDALLSAYFDRLRRPARTVYVLDVSGSMQGPRLALLQQALGSLTGVDPSLAGRYCRFRGREEVVLVPFSTSPGAPQAFTVDEQNPQPARDAIRTAVDGLRANGDTAVYDSLLQAYGSLNGASEQDHFLSIVLMTDGENNHGKSLADFQAYAASRAQTAPVRVFPILFGEAAVGDMQTIANSTGGQVWDARSGDLARVFCQIRGYQ